MSLKRPGSGAWEAVVNGLEVPLGAAIRSGLQGEAELRFANNGSAITIGPNTFVRLEDLAGGPMLLGGDVRVQVDVWYGEVTGLVASGLDGSRLRFEGDDGRWLVSAPPPGERLEFRFAVAQPRFRFDLLLSSTPGITSSAWQVDYYTMSVAKVIPEPSSALCLVLGGALLGLCVRARTARRR